MDGVRLFLDSQHFYAATACLRELQFHPSHIFYFALALKIDYTCGLVRNLQLSMHFYQFSHNIYCGAIELRLIIGCNLLFYFIFFISAQPFFCSAQELFLFSPFSSLCLAIKVIVVVVVVVVFSINISLN